MDTFTKIFDTIFYPMTAFMDWTFKHDVNPVIATGGLLAIGAGYVGAIMAPFVIKAHFNAKAMDRACKALDKRAATVFNVAASEASYSDFQREAARAAVTLKDKIGNDPKYSSEQDCANKHEIYRRHEYMTTMVVSTGKSTIVIPRHVVEFIPAVVGFQAANDNPEIAVPLYSSTKKGYGLRPDGALIALPSNG